MNNLGVTHKPDADQHPGGGGGAGAGRLHHPAALALRLR